MNLSLPKFRSGLLLALSLSLAIHAGLLLPWKVNLPPIAAQDVPISVIELPVPRKAQPELPLPTPPDEVTEDSTRSAESAPLLSTPEKQPASLAAPPPPSTEEWRLASSYTPRNSKRYRNAWGQQVRSMMGTAVAGPDQGQVRFRITLNPDGSIAQVEELWSTSEKASQLAWKAIRSLPPLPPTPTGKPLVFEQTISFLPYETGWPPSYKLDCLPEPETFKNPFAWDGASPQQVPLTSQAHRPPPPGDCITDSTAATIEEEERELKRQMDQWRWGS